ncbi:hypothetical protein [Aliihoeflea sp. 40Bstr573]|uniref:hypothetical protein n=1 Tax=Aliihoeflea sp. 40Bstr573 TaxID=2696467 RepID=UPI002095BDD0|nr:hypothetical protein [Aliihoeflea sp. 40Bstr573]MCO6388129.1 hypothetical protein [Aliihoeflea sp. 40Bstr573]
MNRRAYAFAAMLLAASATVAGAGSLYQDRVHTDSFGNLVIYAPAGYKRIVVGAGQEASGYRATGSYNETDAPRIAYHGGQRLQLRPYRNCDYGAVLLHGRSYMYGLPDHVVPTPAEVLCR